MASCCWCQKGVSEIFGATFLTITTDRESLTKLFLLDKVNFLQSGVLFVLWVKKFTLIQILFCTSEHLKDLKSFKLKTSKMGSDQRTVLIYSLKVPIRLAILFYMQDKQISSGLEITSLVLKFIKLYSIFFPAHRSGIQVDFGREVCLFYVKYAVYALKH